METLRTLQQAIVHFSKPENCNAFMIAARWVDGKPRCPQCGSNNVIYLEKARLFKCRTAHPKQKFSLKVGTIFEDSPLGLDKWLSAIWLIANAKNGISSYEIHRALGVTQKSAWFMLHRIRLAMQQGRIEKLSAMWKLMNLHRRQSAEHVSRCSKSASRSLRPRTLAETRTLARLP